MPTKASGVAGPAVIELVGPLIDDGGAFARTIAAVVERSGLQPRPGAIDQVAGASPGWALATLLEGHGRGDPTPSVGEMVEELVREWQRVARGGGIAATSAAATAVRKAVAHRPVALLTGLPSAVAAAALEHAELGDLVPSLLAADGADGLPRHDRLQQWLGSGEAASAATALLASAPAMLAAIGARCADVVLVGEGRPASAMLAERQVADLAEGLG